jgi:hypothetical protein
MPDLLTICPYEEIDITISERNIELAKMHRGTSGKKLLVACPECCRTLEITPNNIDEWSPDLRNVSCVPLLQSEEVRIPNGYMKVGGLILYRPGGGDQLLRKREYMYLYGMDPQCYLDKA